MQLGVINTYPTQNVGQQDVINVLILKYYFKGRKYEIEYTPFLLTYTKIRIEELYLEAVNVLNMGKLGTRRFF